MSKRLSIRNAKRKTAPIEGLEGQNAPGNRCSSDD